MITKTIVDSLPNSIGIYIFKKGNDILYIGKSIYIKSRVKSHIENAKAGDKKESYIVDGADTIDIVVTDSEFEALLLESKLIQKYKPPYNVIWKDDKDYLYIKITLKEEFPKIFLVRKENDHKSLYFGPFSSQKQTQLILSSIRKIVPFCTDKKISNRPCFYSKIGLCNPCPNNIVKQNPIDSKKLKSIYKANIRQIIKILQGNTQTIVKTITKKMNECSHQLDYEQAIYFRNKLLYFQHLIHERSFGTENTFLYRDVDKHLDRLKIQLQKTYPDISSLDRIECYDISNLNFTFATSSMVVMTQGRLNSGEYRKFRIKLDMKHASDMEMMEQTIVRRFNNSWPHPQLIVIDGGVPQLRLIQKVLQNMGLTIPLIGIAKNPDRLVTLDAQKRTILVAYKKDDFQLIRLLRDEAHRFSKKYHLLLRNKSIANNFEL